MKSFAAALRGGDRRSIGRSNAVVDAVRRKPDRFGELWECLSNADAIVRTRAADALEKLTRDHPTLLAPYKDALLARSLDEDTADVRWHLIAMLSRLPLDLAEAKTIMTSLDQALRHDRSRIVKVMALQAAADLASRHLALRDDASAMLDRAIRSPWPSVKARARKLTATLQRRSPG
jgi:hypothetical protein